MEDYVVLAQNKLDYPIDADKIFSWCPTMDLITFVTTDSSIWVYRLDGQKVWSISVEGTEIERVTWRPDGKIMAAACVDGVVRLFDSNTGGLVSVLKTEDAAKGNPENINWFSRNLNFQGLNKYGSLFKIDISKSLTKLSPLSSKSTQVAFTAKIVNNEMIRCDNSILDFLVVCSETAVISTTLYGVFNIGEYVIPQLAHTYSLVLASGSSKSLESQFFLIEKEDGIFLSRVNSMYVSYFGPILPEVTLNCSKLIGLLSYFQEALELLMQQAKPFTDYTTRILSLLESEIKEKNTETTAKNPADAGTVNDISVSSKENNRGVANSEENGILNTLDDLCDLLLTGIISDATKIWITDYIGDRGLKRWSKLGKSCYDNFKKVLFYDLIPASEQLLVLLTNISGLADWKTKTADLSLDPENINNSIEIGKSILKELYHLLFLVNEEGNGFDSFIDWLTFILNDITGNSNDDMVQSKTSDIIDYMTNGLLYSKLLKRLNNLKDSDTTSNNVFSMFKDLRKSCDNTLTSVRQSISEKVSSDDLVHVSELGASGCRIQIVDNSIRNNEEGLILILKDKPEIDIFNFGILDPGNTLSKLTVTFTAKFPELSKANKVKVEAEIIQDKEIIVLIFYNIGDAKYALLLSLDITRLSANFANHESSQSVSMNDSHILKLKGYDNSSDFVPRYLSINSNDKRRIGCVVDDSKTKYLIFEI
ncbi:hypothetical protein BVG19_g3041 [[Candida] boidinii]|nr:hypothetical protein BVG19_g3041 [[Candida] boidinii]OWB50041.1 hypothetical protein B5S27_g1587 [[Candida] boidinii]